MAAPCSQWIACTPGRNGRRACPLNSIVSWLMSSEYLRAVLAKVNDEASFVRFVELLLDERLGLEHAPSVDNAGSWNSHTIPQFLDAASAWARDSGFGELPGPKSDNPWQLFAQFMWAGRGYE